MKDELGETLRRRAVTRSLMAGGVVAAGNGIVIADARAKDRPLIYVNPAFESITGYAASDVLGRNCRFLQGPERKQGGLSVLRRALSSGRSCTVILRNYRKDGGLFWNELHIAPMKDADGGVTHFIGIQNDVTRRIESGQRNAALRRELDQRNQELEALNEQKNALLGMAAHDIRNPLGTILLNVDMLKDRLNRPLTAAQRKECLARIERSTRFMLEMVNSLLDVSKIEAGKMTLELTACDLRRLIRERLPLYRESAAVKRIAIRCRCSAGAVACADPTRIAQVLDNLVTNAIKFSYPETTIRITVTPKGDRVTVAVADEGQGIPEQEQSKLFKPFSKTSVRGTAGEHSTGLGLSICRKIIEAHEGRITVQSRPGEGATFSFDLPAG